MEVVKPREQPAKHLCTYSRAKLEMANMGQEPQGQSLAPQQVHWPLKFQNLTCTTRGFT
jgi:hypothetical protein